LIDDNLFNSLTSVFTSVEKSFKARELMKLNPNLSPFLSMMSTSTLAPVLPDFVEDYGENKRLDVKVSLS
jgi:hypothetical protein